MPDQRTILRITGEDRVDFLQGLLSNDMKKLADGLVYAALLSPQGKYLFDFFLFARDDAVFLDVKSDAAAALSARLNMYRLRADVAIEASDLLLSRGLGDAPEGAFCDPRDPALGWRTYRQQAGADAAIDWAALRVARMIPETGVELIPNETYILEMGFERLNGVDFRKGCYVGQEVTARMKHKTALKKGLAQVSIDGPVAPGAVISRDGKEVGRVHTVAGPRALAYLRFERAGAGMEAAGQTLHLEKLTP